MTYLLISTLIMFAVTLIPRFIPLTFFRKKITSRYLRSFLKYMPYAVLAALTFPYVFFSTGSILAAAIATAAALALSFFNINMALAALIGFGLAFGFSFIL